MNNSGTDGGAIFFNGQVRDCNIDASFVNNHASNDGGAIYFYPSIFGCNITGYFADNVANRDGGLSTLMIQYLIVILMVFLKIM